MTKCRWCDQEMNKANGCTANNIVKFKDGSEMESIPYHNEFLSAEREDLIRCHDCNCLIGEKHHPGCDMERCPKCGGQIIGCDCGIAN